MEDSINKDSAGNESAGNVTPDQNKTVSRESRVLPPEAGYVIVGNLFGGGKTRKVKVKNMNLSVEELLNLEEIKEFAKTVVGRFGILKRSKD